MKLLNTLSDALFKIEKVIVILLMSVILLSIVLGVVFRYFLNSPLTWTDELAIYMLIWITFVGGSMSVKNGKAASLDLVFDQVSVKWQRIFLIAGYGFVIIFSAIVTYMAIKWISNPAVLTQISPGLKISMFLPYLSIPFGLFCLTIHAVNHLVQAFIFTGTKVHAEGGQ
ncbi:MAG: TRAP transporter small permease [Bacillus sp. (in: firmicutes)]